MDITTQVVGFGPAALGLFVAADRIGKLPVFANQCYFIEARSRHDSLLKVGLNYSIHSNSAARDFIGYVRKDGMFANVLRSPAARYLKNADYRTVPLSCVCEFLSDMARKSFEILNESHDGGVIFGSKVSRITVNADGTYTSYSEAGEAIVRSKNVVIASGASQDLDRSVASLKYYGVNSLLKQRCFTSDQALRDSGLDQVIECLKAEPGNKRICIVGGSHSGFALLQTIADVGRSISAAPIIDLVYRNQIRLYYKSLDEAREDNYLFNFDQDDETGEINRFSGLRRSAKECYKSVLDGSCAARLLQIGTQEARRSIEDADVVVFATGYSARRIIVTGVDGRMLVSNRVNTDSSHVSDGCRLFSDSGKELADIFGIGLGYPRRAVSGAPRVGINLFHGEDAMEILNNVFSKPKAEAKS